MPIAGRSEHAATRPASARVSARPAAAAASRSLSSRHRPEILVHTASALRAASGEVTSRFGHSRRESFGRPTCAWRRCPSCRRTPDCDAASSRSSTGPLHDLDVARRVDVRAGDPGHLGLVLHVHVLVDDDDALGEHELPEPPERAHDLPRVPGIALVDRDEHDVVEDAGRRKVHVDDLRQRLSDERQEDALAGLARGSSPPSAGCRRRS